MFEQGICVGAVNAITELKTCPPPTTTLEQHVRIVVPCIDARTERLHERFRGMSRKNVEKEEAALLALSL
jgi:hypothetical protein